MDPYVGTMCLSMLILQGHRLQQLKQMAFGADLAGVLDLLDTSRSLNPTRVLDTTCSAVFNLSTARKGSTDSN